MPPPPPPSPTRHLVRQLAFFAAVMFLGAVLSFPTSPAAGLLLLVPPGMFVALLLRVRSEGEIAPRLNIALEHITRGHTDEAEAMLDALPASKVKRQLRRASEIQRALIAIRRDDAAKAVEHATRAAEGRTSYWSRTNERVQIVSARAVRALANAGRGETAAALDDVAHVRASADARVESLARAAVAEAIVLSRQDKREELAALLTRERRLLLEFAPPRERALVRALQRSLFARTTTSAYREAASREEARSNAALASWMANVAPATRGLATVGGATQASVEQVGAGAPLPDARAATAALRKTGGFKPRAIVLWACLIGMFVGIWQFLAPEESHHAARHVPAAPPPEVTEPSLATYLLPFVAGAVAMVVVSSLHRRFTRRLLEAERLLGREDDEPAERAFRSLAKSWAPLVSAQAGLALCRLEARRGRLDEALGLCDKALARVAKRTAGGMLLIPALMTERVRVLALLGRPETARELAALVATQPAYPMLAAAQLRVRLVQAVRAGDVAAARALAAQRTPDMPLPYDDELLADIASLSSETRPVDAEVQRLRDELRIDPRLRAWLLGVWPSAEAVLLEASARASGGAARAGEALEADVEEDAVIERAGARSRAV